MSVNGPQIYYTLPGLGITITQTTVSSFVVMLILCIAGILLGRNLQKRPTGVQVLVEKGVTMLRTLVVETMGPQNAGWVSYIGALFLSSLLGSLIGMTGFLRSTTADVATTGTWAVMTSILCWYHSIRNFGFIGWLKGFTTPTPIMLPMNIVSELAQPVSLAFRHFGNVMGGSIITSLLYWALASASSAVLSLVGAGGIFGGIVLLVLAAWLLLWRRRKPGAGKLILAILFLAVGVASLLNASGVLPNIPILQVGLPAILSLYFDLFSALIQAFVFSLLSMSYLANSYPSDEEAM